MRRQQLTQKASLNALAGSLDYIAGMVVSFVITPVLLGGLGSSVFGLWQALQRFTGAISVADGRSSQVLKWVIANHQDSADDAQKRRDIGAALWAWGTSSLGCLSSVVSWYGSLHM